MTGKDNYASEKGSGWACSCCAMGNDGGGAGLCAGRDAACGDWRRVDSGRAGPALDHEEKEGTMIFLSLHFGGIKPL